MAGVKTYNPRLVTVMYGGMVITGFAENSMVKCERNEDNNIPHVGVLGEVSRAENADNTGKITISLAGTSPFISILARKAAANEIEPISVVDMNRGGVNIGGSEAWIVKAPPINLGKEIEEVDIEFFVADYTVG
ncbi:phage structural protein [Tissierella praeacuta]|uniref:phage structural protein n=1 Tax=Tissierella praeacuta TaxID=43131 RepID=UPI002FD92BB3